MVDLKYRTQAMAQQLLVDVIKALDVDSNELKNNKFFHVYNRLVNEINTGKLGVEQVLSAIKKSIKNEDGVAIPDLDALFDELNVINEIRTADNKLIKPTTPTETVINLLDDSDVKIYANDAELTLSDVVNIGELASEPLVLTFTYPSDNKNVQALEIDFSGISGYDFTVYANGDNPYGSPENENKFEDANTGVQFENGKWTITINRDTLDNGWVNDGMLILKFAVSYKTLDNVKVWGDMTNDIKWFTVEGQTN